MTDHESKPFSELTGVALTTVRGTPAVRVESAGRQLGLVFLQGAHVAAWSPNLNQGSVVFMSENAVYAPGKALRGGVPICFPWFGAHAEHGSFPAHGFARSREFSYRGARLDAQGNAQLELGLESDEQTLRLFPHAFSVRLRVTFAQYLQLEFEVQNRDTRPFSYEEALHSYFSVGDIAQVGLRGLRGARYADKVRGMAIFQEESEELRFVSETDRVYESTATCTIGDPVLQRSIVIEKANSGATVVWNPWAERAAQMSDLGASSWPHMLCVETANVGNSRVTLAAGESHILRARVTVTA